MTVRVQNHLTPPNFSASHHFGTWQFGKRHFSMNISSPRHFGRCMFRPCEHGHFVSMDVSTQGLFGTDISAPEHFGTWIFWHLAKQYGHFSPDIFAPAHLRYCAKCPCAEMSPCRNLHGAEKSLWQKVLVNYPNFHGDKMSRCRYVCRAKTCRNAGNFKKLHMPPHTIDGSVSKFCQNLHLWSC
jgi:hypothetical protein